MQKRSFLRNTLGFGSMGVSTGLGLGASSQAFAQKALPQTLGGSITDVPGVKVGHFTDTRRPTGCTVILTEENSVGGVDVRGAAPGTRETDLLAPTNLVETVHAILLSGGSAFGLDAAAGVVRYLEEKGIGYPAGPAKVPIVPAAILFDLTVGDWKIRPDAASAYAACQAASTNAPAEGSVGAGTGATIGKMFGIARAMKGGIGTASIKVDGVTIGAIVAVNAVGDVIDPNTGKLIAGARSEDGKSLIGTTAAMMTGNVPNHLKPGMATTIGVVATDAKLTKAQAQKVAQMAHDGYARSIDPIHTMFDGDTIFALATGKSGKNGNVFAIGTLAAKVMEAAVVRAIVKAKGISGTGLPTVPAWSELA